MIQRINKSVICAVAGLSWLVAGCNGTQSFILNVSHSLTINPNSSSTSGSKVPPGAYNMAIAGGGLFSSPTVTLTGNNGTFSMDAHNLGDLADKIDNEGDQQVDLSASQLQQPFDLQLVSRQTLQHTGATETHSESCVAGHHTEQQYVCHNSGSTCDKYEKTCTHHGNKETCTQTCSHSTTNQSCGYETNTVTDYGSRNVTGRTNTYRTTTRVVFIQNGNTAAAINPLTKDSSSFEELGSGYCN